MGSGDDNGSDFADALEGAMTKVLSFTIFDSYFHTFGDHDIFQLVGDVKCF